jgi:hypothetical protein
MRGCRPGVVIAIGVVVGVPLLAGSSTRIDIVYHFGVDGRNQLDTAAKRFKKDMILDGQLTTRLTWLSTSAGESLRLPRRCGSSRPPL